MRIFLLAFIFVCAGCASTETVSYISPCANQLTYSHTPLLIVIAAINRCHGEVITFESESSAPYYVSGETDRAHIETFVKHVTTLFPELTYTRVNSSHFVIRTR